MAGSRSLQRLVLCFLLLLLPHVQRSSATAVTDPDEVRALNKILGRWGQSASLAWNISGEPCSGWAIDATNFGNPDFNPAIKCDCSFRNNRTCHIIKLKVCALDVIGTFPEELQSLTHLTDLNLTQNYLTGPLPAFIGNLTDMQHLSFEINALSGPIPKELGNLKNLISLRMGTNSFNGSLPYELGNLTSLVILHMDSSGVSGELPPTLSKLKNLQSFRASDNRFTGKIPDFIGSWTNLNYLRLQGNSFQGPIPSIISTLTKLIDLRIGDITSGSSSLAFINSLTSLEVLILRNSLIADNIPSNFSQFSQLLILDLSFNNITGPLPQSLFNLIPLTYLFLGNNSLSGNLPTQKSASLQNIDLSYNQLTGKFPSWVSKINLNLNLVANNYVIDRSNSILPTGLDCLQRNIPCSLGSPIYSSFAINCGGNKPIIDADGSGTVYESDNSTVTAASYYVSSEKKWAVSNVGTFINYIDGNYKPTTSLFKFQNILSSPVFSNTSNSELFQTERLSPSSLRYYGLGLENGNYSVKLQFAESQILDPPTWKSVGKIIFDIYIQGDLKEKDFDIKKEAKKSFTAVEKNYISPVTNNFLEIHFFWAGRGTCCVPTQGYYGAAISAISVSPFDFSPTVSNKPPTTDSKKNEMGVIVGVVAGIAILGLLIVCGLYIQRQRKKRLSNDDKESF